MHYLTFRVERPGASVAVTLQLFAEGEEIICGLRSMEGRIELRPKALRAAAIEELQKIEVLAKSAGCTEMRHSGDERAWCLADYEPMPELPHGRKKRL